MPGLVNGMNRLLSFFGHDPEYVRYMRENETGYRSREEATVAFYRVRYRAAAIQYPMTGAFHREYAMRIYGRAGRPRLGFLIVGSGFNRVLEDYMSTTTFPYIDSDLRANFGRLTTGSQPLGSVLNTSHWHMFLNDMMILGAVANRIPFYLASRRDLLALWDSDENRPTLFARELAGLFAAGYHILQLEDDSEALVPPYGPIPIRSSLRRYIDAIPALTRTRSLVAMTENNLRAMRFTPETREVDAILQIPRYPHPRPFPTVGRRGSLPD